MLTTISASLDSDRQAAELGRGWGTGTRADAEGYRRAGWKRARRCSSSAWGRRNLEQGLLCWCSPAMAKRARQTAAFGLVLRHPSAMAKRVAVVQFIKGRLQPGEAKALRSSADALVWQRWGKASPGKPRTATGTRQ